MVIIGIMFDNTKKHEKMMTIESKYLCRKIYKHIRITEKKFNFNISDKPMEMYKFSKVWVFCVSKMNTKLMNLLVGASSLIMLLGLVLYFSTGFVWLVVIPFGFPTMTFVIFKTCVVILENIRIRKYCKRENITTDDFNDIYSDVFHKLKNT